MDDMTGAGAAPETTQIPTPEPATEVTPPAASADDDSDDIWLSRATAETLYAAAARYHDELGDALGELGDALYGDPEADEDGLAA